MLRFLGRRLGAALVLLWLVLTGSFLLAHLAPGEPSIFFEHRKLTGEQRAELRALYGLDRPLPVQYLSWLKEAGSGNWGSSFSHRRPAMELLLDRLPATALLVAVALVLEHLLGLLCGVYAAYHADSLFDRVLRTLGLALTALPIFVVGPVLIELVAVRWQLLPGQQMSSEAASGWSLGRRLLDLAAHLTLPVATLVAARFGGVFRFVRNGMLDILSQDYLRTARTLGISETRILWRHALPNAVAPLIHRLGVSLPILLSGTLILEVIFSWPGIGVLAYNAVLQRDYPLILAATALSAALVVVCNLLADLGHAWLDPRLREQTLR